VLISVILTRRLRSTELNCGISNNKISASLAITLLIDATGNVFSSTKNNVAMALLHQLKINNKFVSFRIGAVQCAIHSARQKWA